VSGLPLPGCPIFFLLQHRGELCIVVGGGAWMMSRSWLILFLLLQQRCKLLI
jgi:hypothetical protein